MYTTTELVIINVLGLVGSAFLFYAMIHAFSQISEDYFLQLYKRAFIILFFFLLTVGISCFHNSFLNLISFFICMPLMGILLFGANRIHFIYYVILSFILLLCDCLVSLLSSLYLPSMIYFSNPIYYTIFYIILIRMMEFLFIKVTTHFLLQKKRTTSLSRIQFFSTLLFPIFSILFLYTLLYFLQFYTGRVQISLFLINVCILFGLNIYFSYAFESLLKNNQLTQELQLMDEQSKLQYTYYEELERRYNESRQIIHDMRFHIQSIEQLASLHETETLTPYTNDLHSMLNKLGMTYYTSHKVLNLILNDKVHKMRELGIEPNFHLHALDLSYLNALDCTTIFSNLFDNAITAASEATTKYIIFEVNQKNDFTSFTLTNTCLYPPKPTKKQFLSTKKNHTGLGLGNVERALAKYHSDLQIKINDSEVDKTFSVFFFLSPP